MNAPIIDHENRSVRHHDGLLHMRQSRLPFDISLESLEPFEYVQRGLTFSYAGMRIHFTRNDFGVLIGGYYGPTAIFSMLSLVSYSIKADIVSIVKFLLYVLYLGPVQQYIAIYCQTGICTGAYNRKFRVPIQSHFSKQYATLIRNLLQFLKIILPST